METMTRMFLYPTQQAIESFVSKIGLSHLKASFGGLFVWLALLLKFSSSSRKWTKGLIKFVIYLMSLGAFLFVGSLIGIKYKMRL